MIPPEHGVIPISLALGKSVLGVELYDLVANKNLFTFHRTGSRCTFTESIQHGAFELTLRLDWGDLVDGDPTLDLDVTRVEPDGTRRRVRPSGNPRHHTALSSLKQGSSDPRIYDLEYQGLALRLVARKSFAMGVGLSAYIVDPTKPLHQPE